jgi:site-specific DNA-adenine methylase
MAKEQNDNITAKPFVKWAGGKGVLIKQPIEHLPNEF